MFLMNAFISWSFELIVLFISESSMTKFVLLEYFFLLPVVSAGSH